MAAPYDNPRITDASSFVYKGYFDVPGNDGAGGPMDYSQWGPLGIGPDNGADKTLVWSASDTVEMTVARVAIPTSLVTSGTPSTAAIVNTVIQLPNRTGMWSNPADIDGNKRICAGCYYHGGRYIFSGYPYYDGGGKQDRSHWAVSSWSAGMSGPYQVGPGYVLGVEDYRAGIAGGHMCAVPSEWQSILGGPVITGLGAVAIIGRSSYGPSAAVFDPDDLGVTAPVPIDKLVFYPDAHQTAGTFASPGGPYPTPNYFTGADAIRGVAFPAGSRSVLFFGRHGLRGPSSSPAFSTGCTYGKGTATLALDGTMSDESPNLWIYDPTDGGKGPHSYPYQLTCWAYDANDLKAVRDGTTNPWAVFPYAMFDFAPGGPLSGDGAYITGATYDPRDSRLYITGYGQRVYVYEITVPASVGGTGIHMIKNTAGQKIGAQMVSATDGSAITSGVTVYVTGDAGTQALGSVGSGVCTHEGNGYHTYAPAQAETNYELVAFTFIASGAVPATIQVFTVTGDAYARLGAPAGASVSADVAAVKVDTAAILVDTGTTLDGRIPSALVGGRMDASVGAMAAGVLTATAIAADAITDAKVAADVTIASVTGAVGSVTGAVGSVTGAVGSVTGAVGSVTGAVGSVTGNVGGNVTGSVGSVAAGGITSASFAADSITAAKIAADVTTEIQSGLATAAALGTVQAYVDELETRLTAALATKLAQHALAVLATVVGVGSTTTAVVLSTVDGAAASATNDFYNGRVLAFTSGALAGQATSITDYDGTTKTATVVALTGAPANAVTAVIC